MDIIHATGLSRHHGGIARPGHLAAQHLVADNGCDFEALLGLDNRAAAGTALAATPARARGDATMGGRRRGLLPRPLDLALM